MWGYMSSSICRKTGISFEVTAEDLDFYRRISPTINGKTYSIPAPTLCPDQRAMRRLVWRNSNNLYKRSCNKSGRSVISGFPANSPYPIIANDIWWGDSWEELDSGREFNFEQPFFAQFRELQLRAPRPALMNRDSENSDYCNYAGENKNCYMANNGSWYNENCLFGEAYLRCRDCVDCSYIRKSELCYEVVGGEGLYDCAFLVDCYNSASCYFSFNLRNCNSCFLSCNLRGKTNYLLNRPATKAEIQNAKERLSTASGLSELWSEFRQLWASNIHPASQLTNCESSSGDYLTNCKNVNHSFLVGGIQDGKYLLHCDEAKDLWDCSLTGYAGSELYYETISTGAGGVGAFFCSGSWTSSNVWYCDTVMSCQDCFGCVGLKRKQYCILNRQYSKAEYYSLKAKIIEHMQTTAEWGEYFPAEIAPHAYNETPANDFYQLTEEEAKRLGYNWRDEHDVTTGAATQAVPSSIAATGDEVLLPTFNCEESSRSYRIVALELSLLRRMRIAPPRLAPEIRRRKRNDLRNKPRFYQRNCDLTGEVVMTTFAPEREEKICSEAAYLGLLY